MLCLPPRHGKSEMVTIRYPVYRLELSPEYRVIIGAYSQTLAERFSRKARAIARDRVELSRERTAAEEWETADGGGVRAAGVGAGVTGMGGQLIVIDDPVKNRQQANSAAYRQAVWDWYTDDLLTRLEPNGAIILIMTRWHEDDLAGRILASDEGADWTVISVPALAEENDPLGRKPGEALCPARYSRKALLRIKGIQGNSFYALYQQHPQPPEGSFFKRSWFEVVPALPAGVTHFVRYWDKAATADDGDYTVGVLMAWANDVFYIVDVVRGQWETDERDRIIKQTAALDAGFFDNMQVWVEREGGSAGKDAAKSFIKQLVGYAAFSETITGKGNKTVRAEPFQAQAAVGNIKLLAGKWNKAYLDELAAFPSGANDDQVDASTGAFRRVVVRAETDQVETTATDAPATSGQRYVRTVGESRRGLL